jgi:hypothetical protein
MQIQVAYPWGNPSLSDIQIISAIPEGLVITAGFGKLSTKGSVEAVPDFSRLPLWADSLDMKILAPTL